MRTLILASSSPARKALLSRLQYPFITQSPDIDESLKPNENIDDAVIRLSREKAKKIAEQHDNSAVIIGCDQLISLDKHILGKPLTHEKAVEQLQHCSGNIIQSHTGLTVIDNQKNQLESCVVHYHVKFKTLTNSTIDQYLRLDQPYQCAGSIRAEALGIALFEWMRGDDPTALIGLPLISLCQLLENAGIRLISAASPET